MEVAKGIIDPVSNPMEEIYRYEKYNADGKVLQMRRSDGAPVAFIWGYNNEYLVARIDNATPRQ